MAVTYRPRKRTVPYKTRLTGRLMLLRKRFRRKRVLLRMRGSA
jgi:hypothetical protein